MLFIAIADFGKSITHYGDQHVQGSHCREECRQGEESVDYNLILARVSIHAEVSQTQQVLVDQQINEPPSNVALDDFIIFTSIQADTVHGTAKHKQEYDIDDHEGHDIVDRDED